MNKVCLFVINKHDQLWEEGVSTTELENRKIADIKKHIDHQVEIVFTSCRQNTGLENLLLMIQENLNEAKRERWIRSAKAYSKNFLDEKKKSCERYVATAAAASAGNAINPIPGADIAIDLAILVKLFSEIRDSFGLSDTFLDKLKTSAIPTVAGLTNDVIKYAAKEGILILLKNFAGRQTVKTVAKYIPFVGQAIAAGVGYAIVSNVGEKYLSDCYNLAEEILDNNLTT